MFKSFELKGSVQKAQDWGLRIHATHLYLYYDKLNRTILCRYVTPMSNWKTVEDMETYHSKFPEVYSFMDKIEITYPTEFVWSV